MTYIKGAFVLTLKKINFVMEKFRDFERKKKLKLNRVCLLFKKK